MRLKDADKLIEEMRNLAIQEATFGVDEISSLHDAIQECIKVVKEQAEEMDAEETIQTFGELCNTTVCENCPIRQIEKEAVPCNELRRKHPKEIAEPGNNGKQIMRKNQLKQKWHGTYRL